jgi:hypothetical protein
MPYSVLARWTVAGLVYPPSTRCSAGVRSRAARPRWIFQGVDILLRCRRGGDVHDHVRQVRVAGLGLVILVADPLGLAWSVAEAALGTVGRDDLCRRPRNPGSGRVGAPVGSQRRRRTARSMAPAQPVPGLFRPAPAKVTVLVVPVLLDPDLPQNLRLRQRSQPLGSSRAGSRRAARARRPRPRWGRTAPAPGSPWAGARSARRGRNAGPTLPWPAPPPIPHPRRPVLPGPRAGPRPPARCGPAVERPPGRGWSRCAGARVA